ncbi:hypothetical protein PCL_04989 [Purpureocillium lilacinum]|uniref:Uncharacterized protein n=1 Tax=Purpureocillium lilacinum TaxID=33203 RepID=A0A2U3DWE7_PURLI|nr:hypothetical protein PCL_04989 [Purpureocillium lilacinum]
MGGRPSSLSLAHSLSPAGLGTRDDDWRGVVWCGVVWPGCRRVIGPSPPVGLRHEAVTTAGPEIRAWSEAYAGPAQPGGTPHGSKTQREPPEKSKNAGPGGLHAAPEAEPTSLPQVLQVPAGPCSAAYLERSAVGARHQTPGRRSRTVFGTGMHCTRGKRRWHAPCVKFLSDGDDAAAWAKSSVTVHRVTYTCHTRRGLSPAAAARTVPVATPATTSTTTPNGRAQSFPGCRQTPTRQHLEAAPHIASLASGLPASVHFQSISPSAVPGRLFSEVVRWCSALCSRSTTTTDDPQPPSFPTLSASSHAAFPLPISLSFYHPQTITTDPPRGTPEAHPTSRAIFSPSPPLPQRPHPPRPIAFAPRPSSFVSDASRQSNQVQPPICPAELLAARSTDRPSRPPTATPATSSNALALLASRGVPDDLYPVVRPGT